MPNAEYCMDMKLLDTVKTIKTFLLDADSKCLELTNEGQNWVENLKDAVYDADDLMDEFNTIANMPGANKISKKVRRFFSPKNQMIFAFNTSSEVKKLREKLDSLAKNHSNFGFSDLYKPDVKVKKETCSYVYEQNIIGRYVDKKVIVDLLLKDDLETNISFVTIVGIGGLGKTALAQLVFSDLRIKEAFEENMYWVCVSVNFDTKDILGKILKENNGLGFEDMHKNFRERIEGKRYLLVLDDVWSENSEIWVKLKDFLILGGTGSRILVTSRSKKVARAIGNYPIHELEGLSEEDSWELFKKISLADREDEVVTGLAEIGKDIVIKCANVPLCIRVVASLLRDQDLTAWQSYRRMDLANMRGDDDVLMQTLMFSYYHLDPAVRCCFSFCSVFPQDYRIHKEKLISLWSAHGYLVPSGTEDSIEDVGERYFSILLHRCVFQDLCYECRGVTTFKMHDLMHDLAQKIAGKESLTLTASNTHEVEGKVRHLYIDDRKEYLDNLLS
ncbi:putative disease resistance protein RGA3 [Chenopodium quinoa]|uniref:putative disease resistance protein RGA3 n=1 Tax=Chenopodium quinoa TaxID=63459 RepID=UPI000B76F64B|nr:putative disease resistance protein RGA3 [Chenopodium quinoa]